MTRVINDYARKFKILKDSDQNLTGDDIREGLSAIISVKLTEPQFEGQTKTKLGNAYIRTLVDNAVTAGMTTYLEENPAQAKLILDKCLSASRAREAARKARELTPDASPFWIPPHCPANLLTAPKKILQNANCSSLRATPQAVPPRKDATGIFRPSFRCAERF